ncbi:hypothetical protein GINT2_000099 [Glugoides intestinalis]
MEARQLAEISEKIYGNIQALQPSDIQLIDAVLKKETIKYGKIKTFGLEDSQEIVLLTMKQNCLILIKYLLENEIKVPENLLDTVYLLVDLKQKVIASSFSPDSTGRTKYNTDLQAQIEKERLVDGILNLIADVVFMTKYVNSNLIAFLTSKNVPDEFLVNLTIAIDKEIELPSFELSVLNKKILGPVFISLMKSYKSTMRKLAKKKIIDMITPLINTKDKSIVFEVYGCLNQEPSNSILSNTKSECSPEYFGFVSSLILNKESAEIAYKKLEPYFDDLIEALQKILSFPKNEDRTIQPQDEKMIIHLLTCINNISRYKPLNFFKFISIFQEVLKISIGKDIKGVIYDILSNYLDERDLFINKIVECRDDVEKEIKNREFFLLPRLIKFLNAYKRREERELELLDIGASAGSPYTIVESNTTPNDSERYDFRVLGLKSEDPETVIECLESYIAPTILKLYATNLRNTMITDTTLIDRVIDFQLEYKTPIDDIAVINTIMQHSSQRFFDYARLFPDFSPYLNSDLLERIDDDLENGIEWLSECYTREVGLFMLRNSTYFNEILRKNPSVQKRLVLLYEKMLDENLGEFEITIFSETEKEDSCQQYRLQLFDTQDLLCESFFKIFSKQLIYKRFYKGQESLDEIILKKYATPFYGLYVKTKAVCGLDVSSDVEFMIKNLLIDSNLFGYLKIACICPIEIIEKSSNILLNFGIKDNSFFIKNFQVASDLEKFVLFFSIEHLTKEIDFIIKDEIMKNLKTKNRLYLRMCILQLFRTRELDQIIKILEKNYEDKEILFKLCIYNITVGGKYFSKDLMQYGEESLKNKALFILYYLNIWDKDYVREMIDKIDPEASEEMKYLANDIKNY